MQSLRIINLKELCVFLTQGISQVVVKLLTEIISRFDFNW